MPTTNFAFAGGKTASVGWGDRWKFVFGGQWAFGDTWELDGSYSSVPFVLGAGRVVQAGDPTVCLTYKNRIYLGVGQQFNFSDNGDPTGWEIQNAGAGFIQYLSQVGGQDNVQAFGQLQGRLAVLANRSIQIWNVDADPLQFAPVQQLDNIGTKSPLAVKNLGDYDLLFLDETGVRSLRTMETTLNAYPDDIGTPIDSLILAARQNYDVTKAASVVDPATKNYWIHVGGTIYVLSRYINSQIQAWTSYEPRGSDNVVFTPEKFVTFEGQVWCKSEQGYLYRFGGVDNTTYDAYSQITFQLPWLSDGRPDMMKTATSVNIVKSGKWKIQMSMDPVGGSFADQIYEDGSATDPNSDSDSTYDIGTISYTENGTHFSMLATSENTSTSVPAVFSAFSFHYNLGNVS